MRHYGAHAVARDPATAAMLSLIPGLGQLYNGESRKGILFLDVAVINAVLLGIMLFAQSIVQILVDLGAGTHMKVNAGVLSSLKSFGLGNPASLVVLGLVITFVAYAVRDAYDQASQRRRRAIYADSILDMPEAASGSYIAHASIIMALAILTLFFFIPKPAPQQVVEIQLISQEKTAPPAIKTKTPVKANNPSDAHGRHDPTREINHQPPRTQSAQRQQTQAKQSSAESAPAPPTPIVRQQQVQQQVAPAAQQAPPQPIFKPLLAFQPQAPMVPQPISTPAAMNKMTAAVPTTIKQSASAPALPTAARAATVQAPLLPTQISAPLLGRGTNSPSPVAAPLSPAGTLPAAGSLAGPISLTSGNSSAVPRFTPGGTHGGPTSNGFTGPAPVAATSGNLPGTHRGNNPAPIIGGSNPREIGGGPGGRGTAPAPTRYGTGPGPAGPDAGIVPTIGKGLGNQPVNNAKDHDGQPASPDAGESPVNFGPYMEKLQRRIKKCWFPPKDSLSKSVKVRFKIHRNGNMSGLHIVKTSGIGLADQAALNAVENAAPFEQLPAGSPDVVDIEFTFDYNVFSGRRF